MNCDKKSMLITDIQHFSVGNGPGIRTTVFFKGCNLHCPWCHNPETIPFGTTHMDYPKLGKAEECGREASIEEIVKEVLEDKEYYTESGGGVTLSGGEVLLQAEAAAELAKSLVSEGISVIVDTAGHVPYTVFKKLNPYVDTYLYDVKSGSAEKYKQTIGGDLDRITSNLKQLLADGKRVRTRIPLIPGFNTDEASTEELCSVLKQAGVQEVDLLPFHRMGSGKYEAMGLKYAYKDMEPMSYKEAEKMAEQYAKYFQVHIEK